VGYLVLKQIVTALIDKCASYALQQTLKSQVSCCGTGLHSGDKVSMTLLPAPPHTGIVFRRTDADGHGLEIAAHVDNVVDDRMCTTLGDGNGASIATVEHLMAALSGCGIDNLYVEVDGAELPIMDGSAAPFVFLIECAGVVAQDAPRRAIEILKPIKIEDKDSQVELLPGDGFSLGFEIDFRSAAIGRPAPVARCGAAGWCHLVPIPGGGGGTPCGAGRRWPRARPARPAPWSRGSGP